MSDRGETELDSYFPFAYVENPEFLRESSPRQMQRRNENMKYLFDKHIFAMELPMNDDDEKVTIRSKEEIGKRMFGVLLVSLYSDCLLNPAENMTVQEARKFIDNVLKEHEISSLEEVLTPEELTYINDENSDERTRIKYSWHYENLYVLEWACVDARIFGLRMPGNMDPGVVNARHKTLNWLICLDDAEWDDVSTNT